MKLLNDAKSYLKSTLEEKAPDTTLLVAWDEFYRVYSELVRRFVYAQGVVASDADDCVQDVWTQVAVSLVRFERRPDRPGLRAWMYRLVRSKAADIWRKRAKAAAVESLDQRIGQGYDPRDSQVGPVEQYERLWERALLESVISELEHKVSPINYRILRMRMDGIDTSTVAATTGVSNEQVRYRYHRMLNKLKTGLALFSGQPLGA